jgi:hypothetical protein
MKKLILIAMIASLVGCSWLPVRKEKTVEVDKAVPSCPKPPADLPKCVYLVDGLTAADAATPGKVGMAYKVDMTCLRTVNAIYMEVIDQYGKTTQNFDEVKAKIDKANQSLAK